MAKKTLNWNDRIALIEHYTPDDSTICQTFEVTKNELEAARQLRNNGTLIPTPNLDYNSYKTLFNVTSTTKPAQNKSTTTTVLAEPETASRKVKTPQKRGRKGDKIIKAFELVPETPVDAEQFAQEHSVSLAVLRQSKRFDKSDMDGNVKVKKDKGSGRLMIWRESESE